MIVRTVSHVGWSLEVLESIVDDDWAILSISVSASCEEVVDVWSICKLINFFDWVIEAVGEENGQLFELWSYSRPDLTAPLHVLLSFTSSILQFLVSIDGDEEVLKSSV